MSYSFTSSPFEALMTKIPPAPKPAPPPKPPEGHFCYGCARYGLGCVRPCYRDAERK
ncbi:MAG: hypothetical protein U0M53_08640 [Oscillospiraceae bacterium]|nr:hypothetical protein [Oscillospiraceae bacterium]